MSFNTILYTYIPELLLQNDCVYQVGIPYGTLCNITHSDDAHETKKTTNFGINRSNEIIIFRKYIL